jgi:hypothetical protein
MAGTAPRNREITDRSPAIMSSDAIIRIEGLGKRYSLRHLRDQRYIALRDMLVEKATGLFRRNSDESRAGGKSRGQRSV